MSIAKAASNFEGINNYITLIEVKCVKLVPELICISHLLPELHSDITNENRSTIRYVWFSRNGQKDDLA